MRQRAMCVAVSLSVCFGTLAARSAGAQTVTGGDLPVSQTSSAVGFTIYAKAIFPIKQEGRFKNFEGEVSYDPGNVAATRMDLTVYTASVDTSNSERDALLRSGDFFDVDHFPTMHFTSTGVSRQPDGGLMVTGDLTIRGIVKQVAVPLRIQPAAQTTSSAATRFETTFDIDRTEFGLNGTPKFAGIAVSVAKNVKIHLAIGVIALPHPR